jgi:hypothetical protein
MLMRVNAHRTEAILSRRQLLLSPLLLAACKKEVLHQRVDPALAPLIPGDTTTLIGVRVDNLRKSTAWEKLFPAQGPIALETLKKQSGLDLRTGLYEAVFCMGGKHRVALIRGKFVDGGITNAGLEPELKIEGAQKLPYKGFTLVGKEEEAVAFLNSSVALVGRASALRSVIDARVLKNAIPEALLAMVETLPPESHLYAVSTSPTLPEGGVGGLRSLPLSLKSAKAYLDLSQRVSLRAEAEGVSAGDAKKLIDGLRGMLGLLRITVKPEQKEMLGMLDAMKFSQQGSTVTIQADLSLDAVLNTLKSLDLLGTSPV